MKALKMIGEACKIFFTLMFPTQEAVEAICPGEGLVGSRCGRYFSN